MFSIFNRFFSQERLLKIAQNTHKKEWNNRLKRIKKNVQHDAKKGLFYHTVPDQVLRCEYNKDRKWEDIIKDFNNNFPNCICTIFSPAYETGQGNTFVKISWQKKT